MAEILIYDPIGGDEPGWITPKAVKESLDSMRDEDRIVVRIHSPGGDVFDGFAIYNLLVEHPAKIDVKVDGIAASIASVIAMAGDTIEMAANAQMMIHNPFSMRGGDADSMRQTANRLDALKQDIIAAYRTRVDKSEGEIGDMMRAVTWIRAKDAVAGGWATGLRNEIQKNTAQFHNFFRALNLQAPEVTEEQPIEKQRPERLLANLARFPIS